MTKDQEIAALKAQVNALREIVDNVLYSERSNLFLISYKMGDNPLTKTPQQCLADYRNQVIDECVEEVKLAILDGNGFYVARLEELK